MEKDDDVALQLLSVQHDLEDAGSILDSSFGVDTSLTNDHRSVSLVHNVDADHLLTDLVSAGDLFGAETRPIMINESNLWFEPLNQNFFFDTELTYSSHEQIVLRDNNTLYDESPLNSLIFVENGVSSLYVADKTADIFLGAQTETTVNGNNADVSLFSFMDDSTDFVLTGTFTGLSLNIYQPSETEVVDAQIIGDLMILGNDLSSGIDLSNVEFLGGTIEVNTYTDAGLTNTTSLSYYNDPNQLSPSAPPALEPSPAVSAEELLFSSELDIIEVQPSSDADYRLTDDMIIVSGNDTPPDFSSNLKHDLVDLISEPQKLLDAGELYTDPIDVFDDIDFG